MIGTSNTLQQADEVFDVPAFQDMMNQKNLIDKSLYKSQGEFLTEDL